MIDQRKLLIIIAFPVQHFVDSGVASFTGFHPHYTFVRVGLAITTANRRVIQRASISTLGYHLRVKQLLFLDYLFSYYL